MRCKVRKCAGCGLTGTDMVRRLNQAKEIVWFHAKRCWPQTRPQLRAQVYSAVEVPQRHG